MKIISLLLGWFHDGYLPGEHDVFTASPTVRAANVIEVGEQHALGSERFGVARG